MKKKFILAVLVLITCFTYSGCANQTAAQNHDTVKYTIYVGLNDKDTYTQLTSYDEAAKKASEIALKYVDGFTMFSASGAYKDEKGIITHENSLVIEFYSITDQQIKHIMDEILMEFNQNAILMEKQKVNCEFYDL